MEKDFVKTIEVTTTEKEIQTVINGGLFDLGYAYVSVKPDSGYGVEIVVGALFENRNSAKFNYKTLGKLIDVLTDVREAIPNKT